MNELVVLLSRVQFAATAAFHFLFVPLTIGLILLVALFETVYYFTDKDVYRRMSNFWSDLFIINYAFGIVTGFTMTLQFGTNWSAFSVFMGDIIASPLAIEALLAFFLEGTFAGIWFFRRNRIPKWFRLLTVWLIMIGTNLSALWIITVNGFMQNPVGYEILADGSRIVLVDFVKIVLNPYVWYMLVHNNTSNFLLGGFFVMAVSSWHLLKKHKDVEFFRLSTKWAAWIILINSILLPVIGNFYMDYIAPIQPHKIQTINGAGDMPFVTASFGLMVTLGVFFIIVGILATVFHKNFMKNKTVQKLFVWSIPFPYLAIIAGWIVAEIGRQPWIVNGIMKTETAVSNINEASVWFSIISILIMYSLLFGMDFYLTKKRAIKGPEMGAE
jgi:cytochrome d ubiquinol oxidase subunit I